MSCSDLPDSKVNGANLGPTWVLPAPDGPHIGPMILAIWVDLKMSDQDFSHINDRQYDIPYHIANKWYHAT